MGKSKEQIRNELFDLRIKLELTQKERVEYDQRVINIKRQIAELKKKYAKEILKEREKEKNGKKL